MDTTMNADPVRAKTFDEYIGQPGVKNELGVHLNASIELGEPFPHTLLVASPGMGKSSLAGIIAHELNEARSEPFEMVSNGMDLKELRQLCGRADGGIIFIDEIHRWSTKQQENLLTLLEFNYLQLPRGNREVFGWLTVIAATTEPRKLVGPVVERFPVQPHFEPYGIDDLAEILQRMGKKLDLTIPEETCLALAPACFGVPRRAKSLVLAARSLSVSRGETVSAEEILDFCRITADGLTLDDLRYMDLLEKLGGAGQEKMAALMNIHPATLGEIENRLFHAGLISFPSTGRELTIEGNRRLRQFRESG